MAKTVILTLCFLSTMHTGVGTFSGVKAKPESVMYNNTKYGEDVLDQMRVRQRRFQLF